MFRNDAIAGGRQVRNEDLIQYIQAFTVLEGLYSGLQLGDFIVSGVEFTPNASNFDISSGVIYADGELCIFDGTTNVPTPHKLTKTSQGVNPRLFFDSSTKNTATKLVLLADLAGTFELSEATLRQSDLMPRIESGKLRAPLDTNGNGKGNIFRSMLSERSELIRVIPKPDGVNRYVKIGEFLKSQSQVHSFYFEGLCNTKNSGILTFEYRSEASVLAAKVEARYFYDQLEPVTFYTKDNVSTGYIELWVKNYSATPVEGDFSSGTVTLLSDSYSDTENRFQFNNVFSWSATVPTSLVAGTAYTITSESTGLIPIFTPGVDISLNTLNSRYKKIGSVVHASVSLEITIVSASVSSFFVGCDILDVFGDITLNQGIIHTMRKAGNEVIADQFVIRNDANNLRFLKNTNYLAGEVYIFNYSGSYIEQ